MSPRVWELRKDKDTTTVSVYMRTNPALFSRSPLGCCSFGQAQVLPGADAVIYSWTCGGRSGLGEVDGDAYLGFYTRLCTG